MPAALAIVLAAPASDAVAGTIDLFPYNHSGPFVQYPALAVGLVVALPVAFVAGAVSAPVLAVTCDERCDSLWDETRERAIVLGYVAGVPFAVGAGLPFLGLKTIFWTLPSSLVDAQPEALPAPRGPSTSPPHPGPPALPDDPWGERG